MTLMKEKTSKCRVWWREEKKPLPCCTCLCSYRSPSLIGIHCNISFIPGLGKWVIWNKSILLLFDSGESELDEKVDVFYSRIRATTKKSNNKD